MTKREPTGDTAIRHCAIYTRKSSEEGLQQEFNSLDAQREACEAYILSQRHAGWRLLPDMYDDGGISGGTMARPALVRLLDEVRAGRVNVIVVYKVDRLTRSLADFAKIVDVLDANGASFVSVTQHFNTTSSMGRLTLNVLLSFAQFEREIAGERIRDKIAASKKKGMWMGGNVPLGYDVQDRKLVINPVEAETVRHIYKRYAELGSVSALQLELNDAGIVSKRRKDASGRCAGGKPHARGALYLLLQNRIYLGEIVHKGSAFQGEHQRIIDDELWRLVSERLQQNSVKRSDSIKRDSGLLAGLLYDSSGNRMTPTHAIKAGKRYHYYVSASLVRGRRAGAPRGQRIAADAIEAVVLDRVRALFDSDIEIFQCLDPGVSTNLLVEVLGSAKDICAGWQAKGHPEQRELLTGIIEAVHVHDDGIEMWLRRSAIAALLTNSAQSPNECDRLELKADFRSTSRGSCVRLVRDGQTKSRDARLIRLLAEAFAAQAQIIKGQYQSILEMAQATGQSNGHLTSLIRIAYLSPDIVRLILQGGQLADMSASRLVVLSREFPSSWLDQRALLRFD